VNPATEMMRRLLRMGFTGHRILDSGGGFGVLYFVRFVHRMREVVLVWTEDEALAYRTTDTLDELDLLAQPDPETWLWRQTGDVVRVVHALLSQPPHRFQHGPVPPVWTPPQGPR
jgi:hypothetical protein